MLMVGAVGIKLAFNAHVFDGMLGFPNFLKITQ
jgi:hypothetical protein